MTHNEALAKVSSILDTGNTTWQEKKNRLADLIVNISTTKQKFAPDIFDDDNYDFE